MARTTIALDDALLLRLKARAETCGQPLSQVIEDALRAGLESPGGRDAPSVNLPSWPLGGLDEGATIGSLGQALANLDATEVAAATRERRAPSFKA